MVLIKRVLVVVLILVSAIVLAWASGYDFDHRDGEVGFYTFCTLMACLLGASFPSTEG